MNFDEFIATVAVNFVWRKPLPYPETDGNEALLLGVSSVTISNAVYMGELTAVEAQAIYAAIPVPD